MSCPASQAHTLLLDLDQLVVKANKLNDCSYSCSSSPCSTSATDKLLGTSSEKLTNQQTVMMSTTTSKLTTTNFKKNYYDKYLDRFANLIDNYKTTSSSSSSLEHLTIKPAFFGNLDGLNEIFQHGYDFLENSHNSTDGELENRQFQNPLPKTNNHSTNKKYCTKNTVHNDIDYDFDFLTFTDANYSKF